MLGQRMKDNLYRDRVVAKVVAEWWRSGDSDKVKKGGEAAGGTIDWVRVSTGGEKNVTN